MAESYPRACSRALPFTSWFAHCDVSLDGSTAMSALESGAYRSRAPWSLGDRDVNACMSVMALMRGRARQDVAPAASMDGFTASPHEGHHGQARVNVAAFLAPPST
jgi:hypothetical protein